MVDTSDIIGRHQWSGQWFLKVDEEYQQPLEWGRLLWFLVQPLWLRVNMATW